jgi:hypothetical protein
MKLTMKAGPHTYINCPISVAVHSRGIATGEGSLVDSSGKRIPCQVYAEDGKTMVAWIEPFLSAGEEKAYEFQATPAGESGVEIADIGGGVLEVKIGGKLFTRYHYGADWPRPFLYPFIGPKDAQVTRHFPMRDDIDGEMHDHPHHRSVWVAYGEVNGTDNWSEAKGHAWIRHIRFEEITSGPVFGRIRSVNSWTSKDGVKQMEDVRQFTFYNLQSERLVDVDVKFVATEGEVVLTDTKEGGIISVRVATTMDGDKGGMIVNSYGGRTEAENWGKPAHWVDYYGPVEGKTIGIAIMDHPSSFRYPTRWHVRDYGLFAANPFALKYYEPQRGWNGDHTMRKGDELDFRYRLFVHEGDTAEAGVGEKYFGFIAPPTVGGV